MARENVTIAVGGMSYSQWESVEVTAGAKAARGFKFVAAEPSSAISAAWPLAPGNAVQVLASGDLMVTGYIDDYEPEIDPNSHRATITGRSKAADAIDCAHMHPTGYFENQDLGQIAQALDQFGIGYIPMVPLKKIPVHQTVPGATVHQELEVLARSQGQLMIGNPNGSVAITNASVFTRHAGALVEGVNFKRASAKLSVRHKHSHVHVKGQARHGGGKSNLRIHQIAQDQTVTRYRPRVIIAEGDTDATRALQRANWHVLRQSGLEVTAELTVYGWRDSGGTLWDPQKIIYLESGSLKIDQDMAINNVSFGQSGEGTVAKLSLVDPQALGGKSAKGKSNKAWSTG